MRIFNLLIGIIICAIILSCSSDDSNEESENATIFGEWKLTSKLIGETEVALDGCEQGEGIIFLESFISNFIVVDNVDIEPNIIQEGFEQCDFRYATFDFLVNENNQILYTIVVGEGTVEGVDDSITTYEIEILTSQDLRIKSIARSNTGGIEDIEANSIDIVPSQQQTLVYTR